MLVPAHASHSFFTLFFCTAFFSGFRPNVIVPAAPLSWHRTGAWCLLTELAGKWKSLSMKCEIFGFPSSFILNQEGGKKHKPKHIIFFILQERVPKQYCAGRTESELFWFASSLSDQDAHLRHNRRKSG